MNEIAIICDKLKIDTDEVLAGMNTKWNALGFKPGLVGGHCYYAGKIIRAIFSTVSFVCALGFGIFQVFWNELYYSSSMVIVWATSISYLLMGFNIVLNLMDLINIRINKYKVSVYKDEFSE